MIEGIVDIMYKVWIKWEIDNLINTGLVLLIIWN
jgi:hypothetical protein